MSDGVEPLRGVVDWISVSPEMDGDEKVGYKLTVDFNNDLQDWELRSSFSGHVTFELSITEDMVAEIVEMLQESIKDSSGP